MDYYNYNYYKTTCLILFVTTITIIVTTTAIRDQLPPPPQSLPLPSPSPSPEQEIQGFLTVHNTARAEVGVGPLTWSETVAEYAAAYAGQRAAGDCELKHSGGPYGENLLWATWDVTAEQASKIWADEKPNYDYANNTCLNGLQCLHYTQVVWRDAVFIGCARAKCVNGHTFVICSYDPRGKYIGQRPY